MPIIPNTSHLNATSAEILNVIRNNASTTYQDYVPVATTDRDSVKQIGSIIMQYPALQNEFLSSLINRIGRVIITSKMYSNPWAMFKKGLLEFGETVEEIFVNIADPNNYDVQTAETEVFKRKIPDVKAAFHVLNYQKFYKATIQNKQLQQAFLSWTGITELISRIVDSMYTAAYYDEYQVMKYLIARAILNGNLKGVTISEPTAANIKSVVTTIKNTSNAMEFMSTQYNYAGVATYTKKDKQYIIVNTSLDATMDVEVLATAFNMSKADFMGHRVLVDGFNNFDIERLTQLLGVNNASPLTPEEITALGAIHAVLVDEDWFMIFDNLYEFTEQYNGQGLYWNYWYHVWKTFSHSPFANAVVFVQGTPSVTAVAINPDGATVRMQNVSVKFDATVTASYATKEVIWSIVSVTNNSEPVANPKCSIDPDGTLHIGAMTTGDTITIKATSKFNSSVYDTAVVTVTLPEANTNIDNQR